MITTVIFIEILIIGFQSIVWFAFIMGGILYSLHFDFTVLKGWEALLTFFALAVAYTLGVIVDRLSDSIFGHFDMKIHKREITTPSLTYAEMRLEIMYKSEGMARFLGYVRSRVRIARSTAINTILIVLSIFYFLSKTGIADKYDLNTTEIILFTSLGGIVFLGSSIFAWARITKTYFSRLEMAYSKLKKKNSNGADKDQEAPGSNTE